MGEAVRPYAGIEQHLDNGDPCEGLTHAEAKYGHKPGAPAAFLVVFPCRLLLPMCKGWCDARHTEDATAYVRCVGPGACNSLHPTHELQYIPLLE